MGNPCSRDGTKSNFMEGLCDPYNLINILRLQLQLAWIFQPRAQEKLGSRAKAHKQLGRSSRWPFSHSCCMLLPWTPRWCQTMSGTCSARNLTDTASCWCIASYRRSTSCWCNAGSSCSTSNSRIASYRRAISCWCSASPAWLRERSSSSRDQLDFGRVRLRQRRRSGSKRVAVRRKM